MAESVKTCDRDFLLAPDVTAAAQQMYYRLSQSPVSVLMVELVEMYRDEIIARRAQRELFDRDYRSKRQVDLERRAFEAEAEGRRCWVLNMRSLAGIYWRRADRLWSEVDDIITSEKI